MTDARDSVSDERLIDLWWEICDDVWAVPEELMVKFGRAAILAAAVDSPETLPLDSKPWIVAGSGTRRRVQGWHPTHGLDKFWPRSGYEQRIEFYEKGDE